MKDDDPPLVHSQKDRHDLAPGRPRRRYDFRGRRRGQRRLWESLEAVEAAAHEAALRRTSLAILAVPSAVDLEATLSIGSTSAALSGTSTCPSSLWVLEEPACVAPLEPKVVVGLTGQPEDDRLADRAIAEARTRHRPLVAVRVLLGSADAAENVRQTLSAQAATWEACSVSTRDAAVHVRTLVVGGEPVDELVGQCDPGICWFWATGVRST